MKTLIRYTIILLITSSHFSALPIHWSESNEVAVERHLNAIKQIFEKKEITETEQAVFKIDDALRIISNNENKYEEPRLYKQRLYAELRNALIVIAEARQRLPYAEEEEIVAKEFRALVYYFIKFQITKRIPCFN